MTVSPSPRAARSARGYRVIRAVRPAAAEKPMPGLLGKLWQRVCAALHVTPEQWHAHGLARRAGVGQALRAGVLVGGRIDLASSSAPLTSERRPTQTDLP